MKASSFKASYRTLLENSAKEMNLQSISDTVSIEYHDNCIVIVSRYLSTDKTIAIAFYAQHKNSDEIMCTLLSDLLFWANSSEHNSAFKNHIKHKNKAA
jgi:hypothetical protein